MRKTSYSGTTDFHYDLKGHLIAESDGAGTVLREYVWLGNRPIASIEGGTINYNLSFAFIEVLPKLSTETPIPIPPPAPAGLFFHLTLS